MRVEISSLGFFPPQELVNRTNFQVKICASSTNSINLSALKIQYPLSPQQTTAARSTGSGEPRGCTVLPATHPCVPAGAADHARLREHLPRGEPVRALLSLTQGSRT